MRTRTLVLPILILCACGDRSSPPVQQSVQDRGQELRSAPLSDLQFRDYALQEIADSLAREARAKGIAVSTGRHRIERLLRLEASLGRSTHALQRVNALVLQITAADASEWSRLRQRAAIDFSSGDDEISTRVQDLLSRWQRERSESALQYLSSNYKFFISPVEWEQRFHNFVSARPIDTATWAWLVLRYRADETRQRYGHADSETAYRFYLVHCGFGDRDDAQRAFSVPGVEIRESR